MKQLWLALVLSTPLFADTFTVCEGHYGVVDFRVTFKDKLDLSQALPRAEFELAYVKRGSFPITIVRQGKAVAWTHDENIAVVSMKAAWEGHQSSLVLDPAKKTGTVTYEDFLTKPTAADDPPVLRALAVSCR